MKRLVFLLLTFVVILSLASCAMLKGEQPLIPTEGIIYDYSDDGTYAEVRGYEGNETKIVIADTYNGLPVKRIAEEAFYKNKKITSVFIPDSITEIGLYAFHNCNRLNSIYITNLAAWCNISFENFSASPLYSTKLYNAKKLYLNGKSITKLVIPDGVTTIGDYAFYGQRSIVSVVIPNSVTEIGDDAFSNCWILKNLTLGNSVTTISSGAFENCYRLKEVTIPKSVTTIGYDAFSKCNFALYTEYEYGKYIGDANNPYAVLIELTNKNFTTYTIHEDTEHIAYGVFERCARLTNITIPDSVKSIGVAAFSSCDNLTSVVIPDSVTTIGDFAFSYCDNLTSVVIPDSVTTIGDSAFSGCSGLTSVVIPDSVTSIGNYAFSSCDNLTSVVIPDSVTTIGSYAFYNCSGLTSVVIPDSVTEIGSSAFYYCSNLKTVYYEGTAEDWADIIIDSGNSNLTSATRYYYSEAQPTESGNYWHYDENGDIAVW